MRVIPDVVAPGAAQRRDDEPGVDCVVTGVDFTPASLAAATWVRTAFADHARHMLVHVVEPPDPADYAAGGSALRDQLIARAEGAARARLSRSFPDIPIAQLLTLSGRAADELIRHARESGADVIGIGAHRHRGLRGRMGRTTDQLLRAAHVPVLVVAGRPTAIPQKILAAIDNSHMRGEVLRWAGVLARQWGAEVHVVHVMNRAYITAGKLVSGMAAARDLERSFSDQAEAWVRGQAAAAGIAASIHAVAGLPAPEVLARQKDLAADLLIVGSRGAGAISRTLIGSVASAIVRAATCPVLVCTRDQ